MALEYLIFVICLAILFLILTIFALKWDSLSSYFHKYYSFFEVAFILAYFLEQLMLVIVLQIFPQFDPQFVVGVFSLVVITTATLQKFMWERRLDKLQILNGQKTFHCDRLNTELQNLKDQNKGLKDYQIKISEEVRKRLQKI